MKKMICKLWQNGNKKAGATNDHRAVRKFCGAERRSLTHFAQPDNKLLGQTKKPFPS